MSEKVRIKTFLPRPRFKVYTKLSKGEFIKLVQKNLKENNKEYGGYANREVAMIRVRKDKEKYWHPQLQIRIEKDEDDKELLEVRGIIGPKTSIWTFFAFLYGASGAIFVTMGCFVISEYIVKGESIWFWSVIFSILLALGTYLASLYGHYLSKYQLSRLYHFINNLYRDSKFYEKEEN